MDYQKDILNKLLDIYERRDPSSNRVVRIYIAKQYPAYSDRYNLDEYVLINEAIESLLRDGLISSQRSASGEYVKADLVAENVDDAYKKSKRVSVQIKANKMKNALEAIHCNEYPVAENVRIAFLKKIDQGRELPYKLGYDVQRTKTVFQILLAIMQLNKETYVRNFSTALFKDSKTFQKEYRSTVESILFDYTEEVLEKNQILNYYNLYENPTFVMIKGDLDILYETSVINGHEFPDGFALSNASLDNIRRVIVHADRLITVENLTTYHDADEKDAVYIYLGGYHNRSKQKLLEIIYQENPGCRYLHEGDLDVYGFLILENLKSKTGIPFEPYLMDVKTLDRFYKAGLFKPLESHDVSMINSKKDTQLSAYRDVLEYMIKNDCKVEQESIKALELVENDGTN